MPSDRLVLLQIALGLQHIHSIGFVHGEIHPGNILLFKTDGPNFLVKLSDFGLCKPVLIRGNQSGTILGPLNWMTRECIEHVLREGLSSTTLQRGGVSSDIFSAGCTFFFYLTRGVHPFGSFEDGDICKNILDNNPANFWKGNNSWSNYVIWKSIQLEGNCFLSSYRKDGWYSRLSPNASENDWRRLKWENCSK